MIKVFTSIVTLYSSAVYSPAATNQPSYINLHVSASLMLLFVNRVLFVKIECSLSLSSYVHMPLKLVSSVYTTLAMTYQFFWRVEIRSLQCRPQHKPWNYNTNKNNM